MENDDEFLFKESKTCCSEKKVKTAVVGKEKTAAVVKEKPVKAKQAKAPAATTQVDVKSIQTFFGYACMSLSKDLKLALVEEHNLIICYHDEEYKKEGDKLILPRLSPTSSNAPDAQEVSCATPIRVNEECFSTVRRSAESARRNILLLPNQLPNNDGIAKDLAEQIELRNSDDSFNDDAIFCTDRVNDGLKHQQEENELNDGNDSFINDEIFLDDQDDSLDDILLESDRDNNSKIKEVNEIAVEEDDEEWLSKDQGRISLVKQKSDVPIDCASAAIENLVVQQVEMCAKSVSTSVNKEISSVTALKNNKGHDSDDSFYNDDDIDVIAFASSSLDQTPANEASSTPLSKIRKTSETVKDNEPKEDPSSKKQWNPFKPMQITPPSDNFIDKRQLNNAKKPTDLEEELGYRSDDSLFNDDDGLF
uniref:Uncharacterized protein n=1 Tax=Ditylenchus dipsaci TaxID=166011 RepID=A0A915DXS4_9BILA